MKQSVYLFSSGKVKRRNNNIYFEGKDGKQVYVPVENTAELYIFGEVELNKRILEFFSKKGIILHFLNYYEYYIGSFYPREHNNSGLITLQQALHYADPEKRLYLARKFVEGSARNIVKLLMYHHVRGAALGEYIDRIYSLIDELREGRSCEELMAIEGNIREIYYKAFDIILDSSDFKFEVRTRRPPKNRLNALISFGNQLLYTVVLSEIYRTHLDPRIGFLHSTNQRGFTLNLDVAEVFKPVIVDRMIINLIKHRIIKPGHFDKKLGGIYLNRYGAEIFVREWENRLHTTLKHRGLGRNVSYRQLIRLELYKVERHLIGDKLYEPFIMKY